MSETPFFFDNDDIDLFGILHQPEVSHNELAWIFCHPFAEEKLWSHRVYVNLARKLTSLGYPVLRFDYRGYGDSSGKFEESSVDDQLDDISCAIQTIKNKLSGVKSIGLLGLRYGATLAALSAERNNIVNYLVMWDPLVDLENYMQEVLRTNLTTQMVMHGKIVTTRDELTENIINDQTVNVDGYDLSKEFFESANAINLLHTDKRYNGKCLIVQISRTNKPLKKTIENLSVLYPDVQTEIVEELQFWKEIKNFVQESDGLTHSLLNWLGDEAPVNE